MTDSYHFQIEPEPRVENVWFDGYFLIGAEQSQLYFPSGAALQLAGDKIVGRVEAEQKAFSTAIDRLAAQIEADLMKGLMPAPEPKRAPLPHFNQRTEFDAFPDFVVFHEFEPVAPLHTSPTTDSAYPAIAGLLRG